MDMSCSLETFYPADASFRRALSEQNLMQMCEKCDFDKLFIIGWTNETNFGSSLVLDFVKRTVDVQHNFIYKWQYEFWYKNEIF